MKVTSIETILHPSIRSYFGFESEPTRGLWGWARPFSGLIGARELGLLKRTAFMINPARAQLVDEQALFEPLRDRRIAGAALDPWWRYPKTGERVAPSRFPFGELDNVIMTPHSSGTTRGTVERRFVVIATNINRFLRGEPVMNVVGELSRAPVQHRD